MLNERLQHAIAELPEFRSARPLHILQCSSQLSTGSIAWHVWVGSEKYPRTIIKTPRVPGSKHFIAHEWRNLLELRDRGVSRKYLPSPSATFDVDGQTCYAYTAIPGQTLFSRFRNRLLGSREAMLQDFAALALPVAIDFHTGDSRVAPGDSLAGDLLAELTALQGIDAKLPQSIRDQSLASSRELVQAHVGLPVGRIHGDFSPYNFISTGLRHGEQVGLIDWEHAEPSRPQHLDIFRFISACVLMGRPATQAHASLLEMSSPSNPLLQSLFVPWLQRLHPDAASYWLTPTRLRAVWWHYWIHAARRELERHADPGASSSVVYLQALARL
jgi:hypothetical protein